MARVAVIGDVGGHPDELLRALRELGAGNGQLPPGLVVVQVGDLVDRGPDSTGVLDVVAPFLGGRWVQLAGNHEAQYLPSATVFWPQPIPPAGVRTLREWWSDGRMQVAAAITTGGDEYLLTHAGLTLTAWRQLGEPTSAARAADLLNERPDLIWYTGAHVRDDRAGPLWAESGAALHEPWMQYDGVVPFGQIHGHSTVVHFGQQRWRCDGRVRQRTTVDWQARHVRVRVGGRVFIGVDPGHGVTGAPGWQPLVLDDAEVHPVPAQA
ncbi:metallophosphoesterase [Nocardia sp. NRRL S-836]|uniref:metallophosphoesterase n=1 Tax=Nocardia sp. NRRL S-836 TaxID=1519492 RepID=UPI0006AF777B|nr:metallophosphoesterase [Nocardia sp. NRRL S-836]KOV83303.1 metallophosphoesterase [Nocardia sp. NRRL S-836]